MEQVLSQPDQPHKSSFARRKIARSSMAKDFQRIVIELLTPRFARIVRRQRGPGK
jgi:hypothetical protein